LIEVGESWFSAAARSKYGVKKRLFGNLSTKTTSEAIEKSIPNRLDLIIFRSETLHTPNCIINSNV
jgi:hypothetical protein